MHLTNFFFLFNKVQNIFPSLVLHTGHVRPNSAYKCPTVSFPLASGRLWIGSWVGNDPIEKHPGEPAQRWFWRVPGTSSLGQKLLQTLWALPGIRQGGAKYTLSWKELDWLEGSSVDLGERRLPP